MAETLMRKLFFPWFSGIFVQSNCLYASPSVSAEPQAGVSAAAAGGGGRGHAGGL